MMKKVLPKAIAMAMATSMLLTGCGSNNNNNNNNQPSQGTQANANNDNNAPVVVPSNLMAIVHSSDDFSGRFNPHFAASGVDNDVVDQLFWPLILPDKNGAPMSALATYVEPLETTDAQGREISVYTFELLEGLRFSDGMPITADDIIFGYKIQLDPMYDGSATLFALPIIGANEYRYDDPNYAAVLESNKEKAQSVTEQEVYDYIRTEVVEADFAAYGLDVIADYISFDNADGLEGAELDQAVQDAYYDMEAKSFDSYKEAVISSKTRELDLEYRTASLQKASFDVTEIEGIKKLDDRTVEVTILGVDPNAIWQLGYESVVPQHYFGVADDGTTYKKGDLSIPKSRNLSPNIGSGPFVFDRYENNVVSLVPNPYYHEQVPTYNYKIQYVDSPNKVEVVNLGTVDISDPSSTPDTIREVENLGLHYELYDNNGYGYIGLNARTIQDINVRKGLMHLIDRAPSVEAYFGQTAELIERPISKVSWAYPEDAQEVYPFSLDKALEQFKLAGYEQTPAGVLAKDGVQLQIEFIFPGGDTQDHPVAGVAQKMKAELEAMGGVLNIISMGAAAYWEIIDSQTQQIWAAAWSAEPDPEMTQLYHTNGSTNHYGISHPRLDELIEAGRSTNNKEERKKIYAEAMDIIMDEAVEMPFYQRKNMYVYNPDIIDISTLPEEFTPYWTHKQQMNLLQPK